MNVIFVLTSKNFVNINKLKHLPISIIKISYSSLVAPSEKNGIQHPNFYGNVVNIAGIKHNPFGLGCTCRKLIKKRDITLKLLWKYSK